MSAEEELSLSRAGLLFDAPDARLRLSANLGRGWPDARGVFVNGSQSLCAWVNEEDHLRLSSTQKGDNLQGAFVDVAEALGVVGEQHTFAHSARLGYLTTSPLGLGAAMNASLVMRLPLLASAGAGGSGASNRESRFAIHSRMAESHFSTPSRSQTSIAWGCRKLRS
jgi:hypothetical protein